MKTRIDTLLVERNLVSSRSKAQRLVMANQVTVNGQQVTKPGTRVDTDAEIAIVESLPYASRGGFKLEEALDAFRVDATGLVVADVGASTGGFTDCLLQRGARRVYAIDVGYGQLAWTLRQDPRVVVMERTNARYLESLPEPVDLATVDASFISLTLLLPRIAGWLKSEGTVIPLIKPQFEAGKDQVGKGGVIRDPKIHHQVLAHILTWAAENGLPPCGLVRSPLKGPSGNIEFLALLKKSTSPLPWNHSEAIQAVLSAPADDQETRLNVT
ncbi:MAG: TlyA family RNA methyltransferase [Anaerolineae bacterium]|nr:TlyA family RNA methyltransferase [Anaerolineae bacterium]